MRSKFSIMGVAALSLLGFADAAYLTAEHFFKLPLPCSLTQGCDTVLTSQYAMIGPVPISFLGALYYLAILFLAITLYTSESPKESIASFIAGIAGVGLVVSCVLVYLQVFIIGALCVYCLTSAALTLLIFIMSLMLSRRAPS